jgi:branched-chain amino acid transport system ATP-binding protein
MLELRNVTAGYGAFTALWDVSLRVEAGEAVAVVGPNGAGKTTLMRVISGMIPLRSGELVFEGVSLGGQPAHEMVAHGIAHVPEGRRIFPVLTVADNLRMGAYLRAARRQYAESLERVYGLFPVLAERRSQRAGSLSGGEQQMLAIGRCLMSCPELILFDEPSLGLAPAVARDMLRSIRALNEKGVTVLLVEQNVALSLKLCQQAYVLENGRIAMSGSGTELLDDERVRQAYLGL